MKVQILVGAQHAYACITKDHRTLDVLLNPGHSPKDSLTVSAAELRVEAARLIRRAELIEEAIPLV